MYVTLRRVKVHPGAAAEVARRVESGFVPLVSKLNGFVSFSLVDQGETMATVTVFAERTTAEHANQLAAVWVKENLGEFIAGPLEMSVGEIVVHAVASGS